MTLWSAVLVLAAGSLALRIVPLLVRVDAQRPARPPSPRLADASTSAIAALVVSSVIHGLDVDSTGGSATVLACTVGAVASARRASMLVTVGLGLAAYLAATAAAAVIG